MLFFQAFNELLFILTCVAVIASVVVQLVNAVRKQKGKAK